MFFKNREARIQIVKKDKEDVKDLDTIIDEVFNENSTKLIEETGRKLVKNLAITVVAVVTVIKVVDTVCEIAVKKTKSADQK